MRAVSGTDWGATCRSLLTIYRALIRPILDYGSQAFDSASSSQLNQLDRIQNAALRICCGAMKCTSTSALQVECNEMPLKLRRLQQQIELAIKVKSSQSHPANPVFLDHWTLHYGNYTDNNKPITVKVSTFFDSSDQTTVRSPKLTTKPPWTTKILEVDTSLTTYVNKKDVGFMDVDIHPS